MRETSAALLELELLCTELADDRADLLLTRGDARSNTDLTAILKPRNPKAAKIELRLENDFGVYVLFGEGAPFEVPFEGGYFTGKPWIEELRELCTAVITGNFQERLIFVRGRLKGSDHTLVLPHDNKRITEHWRGPGLILPFSRKETVFVKYEAY